VLDAPGRAHARRARAGAADQGTAVASRKAAAAGIDWQPCPPDWKVDPAPQCGFVTVPVDYAWPEGETIRLAVARFAHYGTPFRK
jgi:hypothetical protein